MTASPPELETTPAAGFRPERFAPLARDEGAVCFAVVAAPPDSGSSSVGADGSLRVQTHLEGRVVELGSDHLFLDTGTYRTRVRYLLPSAVDLAPLVGTWVSLDIELTLSPRRTPSVDAVLRDRNGHLLVWARDGALPGRREGLPKVIMTHDGAGRRLAFGSPHGAVLVRPRGTAAIWTASGKAHAAAVRVTDDDAAFVVVRI